MAIPNILVETENGWALAPWVTEVAGLLGDTVAANLNELVPEPEGGGTATAVTLSDAAPDPLPSPLVQTVFNITASSGNGTVATITAVNTLVAGQQVTIEGTAESELNGQTSTVLSTGLSNTQFQVPVGATWSNPHDSGTATVALAAQDSTPTLYIEGESGDWIPAAGVDYQTPVTGAAWTAGYPYELDQYIVDPKGYIQGVVASTGNSGATEPAWNEAVQGTTVDNAVTWMNFGYGGDAATLTFYRRTFFRDTGTSTQGGKNAFVSLNHLAGVGTSRDNQDRALWVSMANAPDDDAAMYAMEGVQIELDLLGAPSFVAAIDGEVSALSVQMSDQHTNSVGAPAGGCNAIRATYFREAGGGSWGSVGPSCIRAQVVNVSTENGNAETINGVLISVDDITGGAVNIASVALNLIPPTSRFPNGNIGIEIGNYGTNVNDFALSSTGGQWSILGPVGLTSLFANAGTLALLGSFSAQGLTLSALVITVEVSITVLGTTGATHYSYVLVCRDSNGNGVASSAGTITNGNATLSGSNSNYIEIDELPIGTARIDIYRTVGGATQGKIFSSEVGAIDYSVNNAIVVNDTGLVGDATTPPVGNATGSIATAGPIAAGKYTVAALPPGIEGQTAYATNGRKVGELSGAGTGVPVYFSQGSWRVYSTDAAVAS